MVKESKYYLSNVFYFVGIIMIILYAFFPLFWMISCSFKPMSELFKLPPKLFPSRLYLSHYVDALVNDPLLLWLKNSILTALISVGFNLICAPLAAYSLSRFNYRGKEIFMWIILLTYIFPSILLAVPLFVIYGKIGLIDTKIGLAMAYTTFSVPFSIWFLRSYFDSIPKEIDEQAMIDGASRLKAFVKVILPLSKPGIAAIAMYSFILAWSEYLLSLILMITDSKKTITVGMSTLAYRTDIPWGEIMAACTISFIPALVFLSLAGKHFIKGLSGGAIKE